MTFKVTIKDGRVFFAKGYSSLDHIHNNAWMNEGVVHCDGAIVSTSIISLIEVVPEPEAITVIPKQ